jgi:hypothetical protein
VTAHPSTISVSNARRPKRKVRSVADIHLAYMPFSHSGATAAGGALLAWLLVQRGLGRPLLARKPTVMLGKSL